MTRRHRTRRRIIDGATVAFVFAGGFLIGWAVGVIGGVG